VAVRVAHVLASSRHSLISSLSVFGSGGGFGQNPQPQPQQANSMFGNLASNPNPNPNPNPAPAPAPAPGGSTFGLSLVSHFNPLLTGIFIRHLCEW
jgi:hypothetical protein